jgi:NADH dehydrogenase
MAGDHVNKVFRRLVARSFSYSSKAREIFELYDTNGDNTLELNELVRLLEDLGNKITSLPAVRLLQRTTSNAVQP